MSEIADRDSFRYSQEQKDEFVLAYYETGNLAESCRRTGVGYEASKQWSKQDWFETALSKIKTAVDRQMDRRLTTIVDKAMEAIEDRIDKGEERITKSGEVVVLKPGLAALTMAMGVAVDKRQIIRSGGQVTSEASALDKLAEALRALAPKPVIIEATTVEFRDHPRPPAS